jgi:hypothetical protein
VGIDDPESGRLDAQMNEDARKYDVLVHIGEIPGVKGVLIVHEFIGCMILSVRDHAAFNWHMTSSDTAAIHGSSPSESFSGASTCASMDGCMGPTST